MFHLGRTHKEFHNILYVRIDLYIFFWKEIYIYIFLKGDLYL